MELDEKNYNRHIYLYCKGHYQPTDIIEDFRLICAERCGSYNIKYHDVNNMEEVEKCKVSVTDVIIVLSGIVWKYIDKNEHLFTELINDINPSNTRRVGYINKESTYGGKGIEEEYDYRRALLHKYKSILKMLDTSTILKVDNHVLGEPDYELFPMFKLKEEKKEE